MDGENMTQQTEETAIAPVQEQGDDSLDDIDLSDVQAEEDSTGEETTEEPVTEGTATGDNADQQNSGDREEGQHKDGTAPEEGAQAAEAKPAEADQLFELKHLGEVKKVGKDEIVTLAQKGLDYEHIRQERDGNKVYRDFLQELADKQKTTPESLMDTIRANLLVEDEKAAGRTMDQATALERVKLGRERKEFEAERQKGTAQQEQETETEKRRRDGFLQFAREYPKVDVKTIPKEVWEKVNAGGNLADAYARYESRVLREENEKLKQNQSNKEKSTGSRKTAGAPNKDSAFDNLWYNGE